MTTSPTSTDLYCHVNNGIRLCYRTAGSSSNPPVVLVAGLGLDLTSWHPKLVEHLVAENMFVVRLDNRDTGRSSRIPTRPPGLIRLLTARPRTDSYNLTDMANDTVGLLDHLGIGKAHLVGMSMGGMIAQSVASQHPDRVTTLTSIFSTTGARKVGQPAWSTRVRMAIPAATTREESVSRHLMMTRHVGSRTLGTDEAEAVRYARGAWDRAGGLGNRDEVARQINAIYLSGDRTSQLRRVSAPTLVVHGDDDRLVHPSGGRATAAAIPAARAVTIPGMGHDLTPRPVIDHLVDLVSEHIHSAEEVSS
ncbi:alpha/beta fold hydrolase [Nocardia sp. NPDC057663]|uniref:alpha/beta fold hydrolase n=1 Tax=Nocardia sp. NPDC057663 TaxID=3346201 RepID=UPI00366F5C82